MASITVLKRKGGKKYRASVNLKGYPRQTKVFDRQSEAVLWGEDVEHALKNGLPLPGEDLPSDDMRLSDAVDKYLVTFRSDASKSKHTKRTRGDTGNRLIKYFPNATLRTLTKEDIEAHKARRLRVVGSSTVRLDMSMLNRVYEMARIEWGMRDLINPGKDVPMPAPPPERKKIVPEIAFEPLLRECKASKNPTLYPLVFLLLNCGMRPEEAVLLRWHQVLWKQGVIDLTKTKTDPLTKR